MASTVSSFKDFGVHKWCVWSITILESRGRGMFGKTKQGKNAAHQQVLQQGALVLGPEVDAAGEVRRLLQQRRVGGAKHAGINADLAPLQGTISGSPIKKTIGHVRGKQNACCGMKCICM